MKIIISCVIACCLGWLGIKLYSRLRQRTTVVSALQHQLPDVRGVNLTGQPFLLRASPASPFTLIVFFNPSCGHCDYEAEQLQQHAGKFAHGRILMVSDDKLENIESFSRRHKMSQIHNIDFIHMSPDRVFATFGSVSVPQLFLYNQQGQLLHTFKGEVSIDQILQWL